MSRRRTANFTTAPFDMVKITTSYATAIDDVTDELSPAYPGVDLRVGALVDEVERRVGAVQVDAVEEDLTVVLYVDLVFRRLFYQLFDLIT